MGTRIFAAIALAAGLLAGCRGGDPEREIRQLLAAAAEAAEARDGGFFAEVIGTSYRDAYGNDRAELVRTVRGYFLANQRVQVVSRIDEVMIEGGDAARATVHAGLIGQQTGAALLGGLGGDLYRFDLELVNDDGDWRIIGATWRRALGE
jgi:hypothetical protein